MSATSLGPQGLAAHPRDWSRQLNYWLGAAILPGLVLLILLAGRQLPDLQAFRVTGVQQRACADEAGAWQPEPAAFGWRGGGCQLMRAELVLPPRQRGDQVLLFAGIGRDFRAWLNGRLLAQFEGGENFDSGAIPRQVAIPPGLLDPGRNELLLQVRNRDSHYDLGRVRPLYFGPAETLSPVFSQVRLLSVDGGRLALFLGMALMLVVLPLVWVRRQDRPLRWFAYAVIASQPPIWNTAMPWRLLDNLIWQGLSHFSLALALFAVLRYSHLAIGRSRAPRAEAYAVLLSGALLIPAMGIVDLGGVSELAEISFRAILLGLLLHLGRLWWRAREAESLGAWFAGAAWLCAALGVADSLRVHGNERSELTPYLLHWGIMLILSLLLINLMKRIVDALGTAESARQAMAIALEQRTEQLNTEFGLRQQAERERALAEERQRIMRDMHDGIGGQLVMLIGQAEGGHLSADSLPLELRRSLQDLRLMIDSLDDACADLGVALAMLRQRLQEGLACTGLQTHWHPAQLPDLAPVPPDVVLQVLRIIQEAIVNVVKHAKASRLWVSADWQQGWLGIRVQDNGIGLPEQPVPGRGLASMAQRAQKIGGEWQCQRAPEGGCRVTLRLPCSLAAS